MAYSIANLPATLGTPDYILINLGANDVTNGGIMADEAGWKSNYTALLDLYHAKWPNAKIYNMLTWRRTYNTESDTLAGWKATVIASRSSFAFTGPDERIFLENGDDGITYTVDGAHPTSPAGYVLTAAQWKTAMGL